MSDGKSEAMAIDLDLDPAQKALAILSEASHQLRMFRHCGHDNPQSAFHLMESRKQIGEARAAVAAIIEAAGIREESW